MGHNEETYDKETLEAFLISIGIFQPGEWIEIANNSI
jgi:hypothetical protein